MQKRSKALRILITGATLFALIVTGQACGDDATESSTGPATEVCSIDGAMESCFSGDAAVVGTGACRAGNRTCTEGVWSTCEGEVPQVAEICGDNIDNDCDGVADEGCPCSGTDQRNCYTGPMANRNVGACIDGVQACENGVWGDSCNGEIFPSEEVCGAPEGATDENCNGIIDDGCPCEAGATRSCYRGAPATQNIGACKDGVSTCDGGTWSSDCEGEVSPSTEICDNADNDCNGAIDDDTSLAGQPLDTDVIPGDCRQSVCNGDGSISSTAQNEDLPDDGNNCTDDTCEAGVATHTPSSNTTTCGNGGVCNGAGQCTGCNTASDCGTDTACATWSCDGGGVCSQNFATNGTVVSGGASGDCKHNVCDGAGATMVANDNSDVPSDGLQCTTDACQNGSAVHTPRSLNTTCNQGGGSFCDAGGQCVACNSTGQCSQTDCTNFACTNNTCSQSSYVNSGTTCNDNGGNYCDGSGNCVGCTGNGQCSGSSCSDGVCSGNSCSTTPKPSGTSCGGGDICDGAGTCVECTAAAQCSANVCQNPVCSSNTCGTNNKASGTSCGGGDYCNGSGSCVDCTANAHCSTSNQCRNPVCSSNNCSTSNKPLNTACTQNGGTVCSSSGNCVECNSVSQCDDGNLCTTDSCSGNSCSNVNRPAGAKCIQNGGNQCDGNGNCVQCLGWQDCGDQPVCASCGNGGMCTYAPAGTNCLGVGNATCNGTGMCIDPATSSSGSIQPQK